MTFSNESPFSGPVPDSVPLPQTPLTGVLVQIVFPEILSIVKADRVADFQDRIRADYPLNQQDQNLLLQLTADGAKSTQTPNWRFFDAASEWRISLTTTFLAIETRVYRSREDLTDRVGAVANALQGTIKPGIMTRIGARYVDRVHGDSLSRLGQLVRPEVMGVYASAHRDSLGRTLSEVGGNADAGSITSRWGFMPANQTHEPDLMPAIAAPSWFLDIDVYQQFAEPKIFDAGDIQGRVMDLATRAYGFFRWVVNDDFLKAFGGQP